ncbi:hypothetical protein VOLCADRAFT_107793 [Volvox carteri f. nagariensis]|uniref:Uncharacterized protein n=1 Tax=Volvox carteri f. nagariensis TaxID=3068 RepID=D8UGF5_VOLCA|nr:uncharacterized protein VOLCADRAFT_107793 [Volvox carteri f. nagariensis]EFJ41189.1 hypothetical protein VOLCADRAFT_107793 [Volvox carteri f. nagariensis]|eukprot:XP_002957757.1 hypothetical protein VOLCADRAFT_107793 [Volvox carteri f. nagariensis]
MICVYRGVIVAGWKWKCSGDDVGIANSLCCIAHDTMGMAGEGEGLLHVLSRMTGLRAGGPQLDAEGGRHAGVASLAVPRSLERLLCLKTYRRYDDVERIRLGGLRSLILRIAEDLQRFLGEGGGGVFTEDLGVYKKNLDDLYTLLLVENMFVLAVVSVGCWRLFKAV